MGNLAILNEKEIDFVIQEIEDVNVQAAALSAHTVALHLDTKIKILLPTKEIRESIEKKSFGLIKGKACLHKGSGFGSHLETDCFVAYGHWDKFGEIQGETIDIIEHLDKFLPKNRRCISLVTFQNGIQNSIKDFEKMAEAIISQFKNEKLLCIGLYNKSMGIIYDLKRLLNERAFNAESLLFMRQMLATFADLLPRINPNLLWTHVAHSEGGLILNYCLTTPKQCLSPRQRDFIRRHLITLVYGGVSPVLDAVVYEKIATYSSKDIALRCVREFLDKTPKPDDFNAIQERKRREFTEIAKEVHKKIPSDKKKSVETLAEELMRGRDSYLKYIDEYPHFSTKNGHTVKIAESLVENSPLIEGDHAFLGKTYQVELTKNINTIREQWGIYNGQAGN